MRNLALSPETMAMLQRMPAIKQALSQAATATPAATTPAATATPAATPATTAALLSEEVADSFEIWPWEYITDPAHLPRIADDLGQYGEIGLDTETLGLDPYQHQIRLIQLSRRGKIYVLDMKHLNTLEPLSAILQDNRSIKIGHFLKFDLKMLKRWYGIDVTPLIDTYTASRLLGSHKNKLADLSKKYLNITLDKTEQQGDWSGELTSKQIQYAAIDAQIPIMLMDIIIPIIMGKGLYDTARLEFELIPSVVDMELAGILLDRAQWENLTTALQADCITLEARLKDELGSGCLFKDAFNPRSQQQVLKALQSKGLPITDTKEETLEKYKNDSVVSLLLEYREKQKKVGTYGDSYIQHINPITGRIHPSYDPTGTDTGRYSCSNPNLQQVPRSKEWRQCFIAAPGCVFIVADYSQIELRAAAVIAKDETMLRAYKEGIDLHRLTASQVYGCDPQEVTKEQRQAAKAVNFGLLYGQGASGLQAYARSAYGVELTEKQSLQFRRKFFSLYRGLARWHQQTKRSMMPGRFIEARSIGGRLRRWSSDKQPWLGHVLNTPVQATAADGMKLAQLLLRLELKRYHGQIKVVHMVHDELVLEAPAEIAAEVSEILRTSMITGMEYFLKDVPIEVEVGIGTSWADK